MRLSAGLDIGSYAIKLAIVAPGRGKPEVVAFRTTRTSGPDPESRYAHAAAWAAQELAAAGARRAPLHVCLSSAWLYSRSLSLPLAAKVQRRVRSIVWHDLGETLPDVAETLVLDACVLDPGARPSPVYAGMIARPHLEQLLHAFEAEGLDPISVEPDVLGLARVCAYGAEVLPADCLLVDVGAEAVKAVWASAGKLQQIEVSPCRIPATDDAAIGKAVASACRQIRLGLAGVIGQVRRGEWVAVGGNASDDRVTGELAAGLSLSPEAKAPAERLCERFGRPAAELPWLGLPSLGAALKELPSTRPDFDLRQGPMRSRRQMLRLAAPALCVGVLLVAILGALGLSIMQDAEHYRRLHRRTQQATTDLWRGLYGRERMPVNVAARLRSDRQRLRGLSGQFEGAPRYGDLLELLGSLTASLPEGMKLNLNSIEMLQERTMLQGEVASHGDAERIARALAKVDRLKPRHASSRQRQAGVVRFTLPIDHVWDRASREATVEGTQ